MQRHNPSFSAKANGQSTKKAGAAQQRWRLDAVEAAFERTSKKGLKSAEKMISKARTKTQEQTLAKSMADFAVAYADQTERDHQALVEAI